MPPHVLILYNDPVLPVDHPDAQSEHEILETVGAIHEALTVAGLPSSRLGVSRDPTPLIARLTGAERPDVVFNLFEGTADHGHTEEYVAGILDWLAVPFTGSTCQALSLARSKHLTKTLLQGAGLPTAPFQVVERLPVPRCTLEWPVIIKPAQEDGSVGVDQGSVVRDQEHLELRVALLLEKYGPPVLVEEFIPGRELLVAIIETPELRFLPVSEMLFTLKQPGYWAIASYDGKWRTGSDEFENTPMNYQADISPRLAERLQSLAQQAFRLLGCRDYARVDFRVRPSGEPYILEVNPNPDLNPTAGVAHSLAVAGISVSEFVLGLVSTALARAEKPLPMVASGNGRMPKSGGGTHS